MHQILRLQVFSLIPFEDNVINQLARSSCDIIFPIEIAQSFLISTQVSTNLESNAIKRIMLTFQGIDYESPYSTTTSIEMLSSLWIEKEIPTIIVLDSGLASIINLQYSYFHSYIIRVRPGSHDYNFEYLEFLLCKLLKLGFLLHGLDEVKTTAELFEYISKNREICFYAFSPASVPSNHHSAAKPLADIILNSII